MCEAMNEDATGDGFVEQQPATKGQADWETANGPALAVLKVAERSKMGICGEEQRGSFERIEKAIRNGRPGILLQVTPLSFYVFASFGAVRYVRQHYSMPAWR